MSKQYAQLKIDARIWEKLKELKESYNFSYDEILGLLVSQAHKIIEENQKEKKKRGKYEVSLSAKY